METSDNKRESKQNGLLTDLGLLALRLTTGGVIAAHGAQKLIGAFDGPGLAGTASMMESLGLYPGKYWGAAAALSESSGVLTALGLLHPLGPLGAISSMVMATAKVHWGKPLWASKGGAELPLINAAAAFSIMLAGPGRFSLDRAFGVRLPKSVVALAVLGAAASVAYGVSKKPTAHAR